MITKTRKISAIPKCSIAIIINVYSTHLAFR
jgi:hypothetical protein